MHTDIAAVDSETALHGILALLVADREHAAQHGRHTERILAAVGFSDEQIAVLTGRDAHHVRTVIERDAGAATAGIRSVIDRARAAMSEQPR